MKTTKLSKLLMSSLALLCLGFYTKAADLVVEEFGLPPAYSSINAAVTAASPGDRIFIKNKITGLPWIEDVTVNKALELLCFDNDNMFDYIGDFSAVVSNNTTITVIGMNNIQGNVTYTGANVTSARFNFIGGKIQDGNLDHLGSTCTIFANIVGNEISDGRIYITTGNVIGNKVTSTSANSISVTREIASLAGDTSKVIGNMVYNTMGTAAINCNSQNQLMIIKNNFVEHSRYGIALGNGYNVSGFTNVIQNNTVTTSSSMTSGAANYGIWIYQSVAGSDYKVEVSNNLIDHEGTSTAQRGIWVNQMNGGTIHVYYNVIDGTVIGTPVGVGTTGSIAFQSNNQSSQSFDIQAEGKLLAGNPAIDAGLPNPQFYDLDLTVNDAGCYGGSNTLDNYFPLHTGGARIYSVTAPFNVRSGNTLNIEAEGYDR